MDDEYLALQDIYRKLYREYELSVAVMLRQAGDPDCDAAAFAFTSQHVSIVSEQLKEMRSAMALMHGRRGGMVIADDEKGATPSSSAAHA